jgi:hypothetical protein
MPVQKIRSGRIPTVIADQHVAEHGTIFYNEDLGDLRLGDGKTLGGIPLLLGGGNYTLPTASRTVLGGVKVDGTSIVINNQVISAAITTNLDGGVPSSIYGGITPIDGGRV